VDLNHQRMEFAVTAQVSNWYKAGIFGVAADLSAFGGQADQPQQGDLTPAHDPTRSLFH